MSRATTIANAAAVARKQRRREQIGREVKVCFSVPEKHMATIQQAADLDHRTMTNFIYHAAVKLAEEMTACGK